MAGFGCARPRQGYSACCLAGNISQMRASYLAGVPVCAPHDPSPAQAMRACRQLGRLGQGLTSPQLLVNFASARPSNQSVILGRNFCRAYATAEPATNMQWVELLQDKDLFKQQCFINGEWIDAADGEKLDVRLRYRPDSLLRHPRALVSRQYSADKAILFCRHTAILRVQRAAHCPCAPPFR